LRTNRFDLVKFFFDLVVGASSLFVALSFICVRPLSISVRSCSSRGRLYLGADLAVVLQAPCVLAGAALASVLVQSRALSLCLDLAQ
jgi:hypothetical protein